MEYLLQHVLWFFGLGMLFLYIFRLCRITLLSSVAVSYALLLFTLLPLEYLQADTGLFAKLLHIEFSALALLAGAKALRRFTRNPPALAKALLCRIRRKFGCYCVTGCLVFLASAYLIWAGPYTEIPADVWAHLGRIQNQAAVLESGHFQCSKDVFALLTQQDRHWYLIVAWLCKQSAMPLHKALGWIAAANSLTFLLGVFSFGMFLFRRGRFSRMTKAVIAALAALFCFAHLGVNVFAYVRYYAFAPAMLNYVVFMAATGVWIAFIEYDRKSARGLLLLPFFAVLMLCVHTPEAVFAACFMAAASLAGAFLLRRNNGRRLSVLFNRRTISLFLFTVAGLALFCWMRSQHPEPVACPPEFRPLAPWMPLVKNALILKPAGPVFEVMTIWGLFIYLMFIIRFRAFLKYPAIIGGMLLPMLTVFNPFVIDLFLRYAPVASSILYRLCYPIPLSCIAGFLAVDALLKLARAAHTTLTPALSQGEREKKSFPKLKCFAKNIARVAMLCGFVLLLLPLPGPLGCYSRYPTLRRTPAQNTQELWADLLDFLRTLEPRQLMTDPVTAYVCMGLTRHVAYTDRFLASYKQLRVASANDPLALSCKDIAGELDADWLVIVNRRNGPISHVGQVSGHWPADALKVAMYYPQVLLEYVKARPDIFAKVWESDGIVVYDIVEQELSKAIDEGR